MSQMRMSEKEMSASESYIDTYLSKRSFVEFSPNSQFIRFLSSEKFGWILYY